MEPDMRRTAQHSVLFARARQEALDEALTEQLGPYRWSLDLAEHRITFTGEEGEVSGRADVLASVAGSPQSLLWGWSPQLAEVVGPEPEALRVREHGERNTLPSLLTEEVLYDVPAGGERAEVIEGLAHEVGQIGIEVFGPEALYFTCPADGTSRACVIVRDLGLTLSPLRLTDLGTALGRYVQGVDDLAWSLDGLAALVPGWTVTQETDADGHAVHVLTDGSGAQVHLGEERDELGRVTGVQVRVEPGESGVPGGA